MLGARGPATPMDASGGPVDLQGFGGPSRLHYDCCDDVHSSTQDGASRPDDHPLFGKTATSLPAPDRAHRGMTVKSNAVTAG